MINYPLEDFPLNGFAQLGSFLEKQKCINLLDKITQTRDFDSSLFLTKDDFDKAPKLKGVNPKKGENNLAETYDLNFVEENPAFISAMNAVLGEGYDILLKKFVMGVPESIIPDWVLEYTRGKMVANLGPYIKPEYRDITYFHGIDWHQDIIDYPNYVSDFITLYVYLDVATEDTSPLFVVPQSHIYGATVFPHNIEILNDKELRYTSGSGESSRFHYHMLLGEIGDVNLWHSSTLHGTKPHLHSIPRISLRYLIQKKSTLLELANRNVRGFHSLKNTRIDIDIKGNDLLIGNQINQLK